MATDALKYTLEGNIAVIHLDDGKANALSLEVVEGLIELLARAEKEAAALVLVGRPERFSAGFDIRVLSLGPDAARQLMTRGAALLLSYYKTKMPVVMACTGHAVAGGALLLMTGDVRVGAEGAYRIGLNEVAIGMAVPVLAMEFARDRITASELTNATLHARIYDPSQAVKAGFLDSVTSAGEVVALAKAEATRLAGFSRTAYEQTKERLRARTIAYVEAKLAEDLKELMG
jgi:enoyl-CoA hydratase